MKQFMTLTLLVLTFAACSAPARPVPIAEQGTPTGTPTATRTPASTARPPTATRTPTPIARAPTVTPTPMATTSLATAVPEASTPYPQPATPTPITGTKIHVTPSVAALDGTTWDLVSYGPPESPVAAVPDRPATLRFHIPGEIRADTGCNIHDFYAAGEGQTLVIAAGPLTTAGCPSSLGEQEDLYIATLEAATSIARNAGTLTISSYAWGVLRFVAPETPTPNSPEATLAPAEPGAPSAAHPPPTCVPLGSDQEFSITGWSPDGRWILGTINQIDGEPAGTTARIWDGRTGAQQRVLASPDWLAITSWSPNSRRVLTIDDQMMTTGSGAATIRIWDAASGRPLRAWQEQDFVDEAAWSPDSRRLAITAGGVVRLWDATTGTRLRELHEQTSALPVWSPNGRLIATLPAEGIRVWDTGTGREVAHLPAPPGRDPSMDPVWGSPHVAWSPDSRRLVAAWPGRETDGRVLVWDTLRHATLTLAGRSAALSPDGRQVLTTTVQDDRVHLWDAATGQEIRSLPAHSHEVHATWSPDGVHLLVTTMEGVRIWQAATGQEVASIRGTEFWSGLVMSPDGQRLLASSPEGVRIWQVTTGQAMGVMRGVDLGAVWWSPDGQRIVATNTDGIVRLYAAPFTEGRVLACE